MHSKFFLVLIFIFFVSCQEENKTQKIIKNKFSIELPDFLTESKDLNKDAILQYQNIYKEFYIIVIEDNKEELKNEIEVNGYSELYPNNLDGFTNLNLDGYKEGLEIMKKSIVKDTVINGLPSKILNLNAKVQEFDIFYSIANIEGKESFYEIMVWTLESNEKQYERQMKQIIQSFKETKGIKNKKRSSKSIKSQ